MQTLQDLIDKSGHPPPEVCLDWAWQLHDLLGAPEHLTPITSPAAPAKSSTSITQSTSGWNGDVGWENLRLGENGKLVLCSLPQERADTVAQRNESSGQEHQTSQPIGAAQELIEQLLQWTQDQQTTQGDLDQKLSPHSGLNQHERLALLTQHIAPSITEKSTGEKPITEEPTTEKPGENPKEKRIDQRKGGERVGSHSRSDVEAATSSPRPRATTRHQSASSWIHAIPKRFGLVAAGGLILAIGLIVLVPKMTGTQTTATKGSTGDDSADALNSPQPSVPDGDDPSGHEASSLTLTTSDQALANETSSETQEKPRGSLALDAMVANRLEDFGASNNSTAEVASQSEMEADSTAPFADLTDRIAQAGESGVAASEMESSQELEAENIQVLESLSTMAKRSELEQTEQDVLSNDLATAGTIKEPLLVSTFPVLQVQRVPLSPQLRTREPTWTLRVAASDGFIVQPAEPQLIQGREIARWIIHEEEAEEPATRIIVQAQSVSSRGNSIRWRVVASCDDLPQVALPLGQKYLDAAQQSLTRFNLQLAQGINQLKLMSRADGLPSGMRSAITGRRRALEGQLKLSTRLLEVVADANQIEGWLDGQLEVHAALTDSGPTSAPPLIQFGMPHPTEETIESGNNESGNDTEATDKTP